MTIPDTTLEGAATEVSLLAHRQRDHFHPGFRCLANGKAIAITSNDDHGPAGLTAIVRAMLSL